MTRDYHLVLERAIAALESDTEQARRAVYDRARTVIAAAGLSRAQVEQEQSALEAAIARIEAKRQHPTRQRRSLVTVAALEAPARESASTLRFRKSWPVLAALGAALLVAGAATYALRTHNFTDSRDAAKQTGPAVAPAVSAKLTRPTDPERSYIFNRQVVYYRSVHPVGTVLVAKAQRFLYIVVSNISAIRYTVGVGRECANVAGLLLVSAKEEWSEDPAQRVSALRQAGGRFGARSLALSDTGHRIHGTNTPVITGHDGCFPLINDDIIHLHDRVVVGTRVVIN